MNNSAILDIGGAAVYVGGALEVLRDLPDQSVHCCVTSPPYYGLRDYGVPGQIGLEKTPDEYVARLVEIFREVRRVLRDDGTCWINLGDSYGRGKRPEWAGDSLRDHNGVHSGVVRAGAYGKGAVTQGKQLMGMPWRVAFALQADGWYLRQDLIWSKPNPMPESVRDRCTKSHEYLFLLSKSERYYFDAEAIAEPFASDPKENYPSRAKITGRGEQSAAEARGGDRDKSGGFPPRGGGRNKRSVWAVSTQPFKEAHFATFPPKLIEPCVLAGCPEGGVVLDPFAGSGTTGEVALNLGRRAALIELNEAYVNDLILPRLEDATRQGRLAL